jgi:hypothetical protein
MATAVSADIERHVSSLIVVLEFYNKFCTTCIKTEELLNFIWGRRGRDRMVVGFITTYATISYHY